MRYTYDHDYHIHSFLSTCSSDPEQNPERILQYARDNRLTSLCLTDHYWDERIPGASDWYRPQNTPWIRQSLPLPQDENIRFLFGCETDMDRFFTLGLSPERLNEFDFIVVPTTHLHMKGFTIGEEDAESLQRRAELWVERLDRLFSLPLPFEKIGIAHLTCSLIAPKPRENFLTVLDRIPDAEMERIFRRAAALHVGIELNGDDMNFSDDEQERILRPYRIAKRCGCKFYLGSDAHHPAHFEPMGRLFNRAIDLLGLEETDKFHIPGL